MTRERTIDAQVAEIRQHVGGKGVVFVSGNFNIIHPGHLRLLRFAAECGDALVVGVNPDGAPGVHVPADLRLEGIRSLAFVDKALLLAGPPESIISALCPSSVVKGREYEALSNPEQAAVDVYGGRLLFGSDEVRFSSIDLIRREFQQANLSPIVKPADYPERHGFGPRDLKATLARFRGMRVTVVGDLIVDEYVDCEALGMSQEDPTLVVSPIEVSRFLGGAAIVAAHARGLGAEASIYAVAGCDERTEYVRSQLASYGVGAEIIEDESRPTTLKRRYRAEGQTLLRVSQLRQHAISDAVCKKFLEIVLDAIPSCDLLIFSDFNYGCLPPSVVDIVSAAGAERQLAMVADSQSSSQVGDVARFKDMLLLTPTEREARLAMRDFSSGLAVLTESLRRAARASNVIISLGGEGVIAHCEEDGTDEWLTDRIPAMNPAPRDPAGAGDSMLACTSMALVAGAGLWQSAYLGSIAAACQVGRVGNVPLSMKVIEIEIDA